MVGLLSSPDLNRINEHKFRVVDRGDRDRLAARNRDTIARLNAFASNLDRARCGNQISVAVKPDSMANRSARRDRRRKHTRVGADR
jgi:hypothetical protein